MSSDSGQPSAAVAALILNLKTLQLVCQQWWPTHCLPAPGSQLLPSSPQPAKTSFCAVPLAFELMTVSLVTPKSVRIFHMDSTGNNLPHPTMVTLLPCTSLNCLHRTVSPVRIIFHTCSDQMAISGQGNCKYTSAFHLPPVAFEDDASVFSEASGPPYYSDQLMVGPLGVLSVCLIAEASFALRHWPLSCCHCIVFGSVQCYNLGKM